MFEYSNPVLFKPTRPQLSFVEKFRISKEVFSRERDKVMSLYKRYLDLKNRYHLYFRKRGVPPLNNYAANESFFEFLQIYTPEEIIEIEPFLKNKEEFNEAMENFTMPIAIPEFREYILFEKTLNYVFVRELEIDRVFATLSRNEQIREIVLRKHYQFREMLEKAFLQYEEVVYTPAVKKLQGETIITDFLKEFKQEFLKPKWFQNLSKTFPAYDRFERVSLGQSTSLINKYLETIDEIYWWT